MVMENKITRIVPTSLLFMWGFLIHLEEELPGQVASVFPTALDTAEFLCNVLVATYPANRAGDLVPLCSSQQGILSPDFSSWQTSVLLHLYFLIYIFSFLFLIFIFCIAYICINVCIHLSLFQYLSMYLPTYLSSIYVISVLIKAYS